MPHVLSNTERPMAFYKAHGPHDPPAAFWNTRDFSRKLRTIFPWPLAGR